MIKLIASDIDGTLLPPGERALNPELFDLILKLKEQGILFVAASGRQLASLQTLLQPVVNDISFIAENGAVCIHENELVASTEIERDLAFRIIDALQNHPNCKPLVSCMDTCYVEAGDDDYLYEIRHTYHNVAAPIEDFHSIQDPILKVAFAVTADINGTYDYFQKLFGSEIKVVTSGNDWIDFIPFHSNKGTALEMLLNKLGMSPADVVSFGDQQNDIEMLTLTGQSYVVSSASPEVAKYASEGMTDSVAEVLKKIIKKILKLNIASGFFI